MTILCTVADDRFGRKESKYLQTQEKITNLFACKFGIGRIDAWTWEGLSKTGFYQEHKALMDNTDPARNGRVYKPFAILQALICADEGDFVIYTDCSPELWKGEIYLENYDLEVVQNLCVQNGGILAAFVKWAWDKIPSGQYGMHTHKNFTLNRCMDKMGMRFYEDAYQNASGFWCIQKTPETFKFVQEWLHWNCIDECCSLGWTHVKDDYSFWEEEQNLKIGHRHDQSISGLLLAARNWKLVDIVYNKLSPYNFLNFCIPGHDYQFIDILPKINIGDTVENEKGTEMKVWKIENGLYVVGKSEASCYAAERQNIKLIA